MEWLSHAEEGLHLSTCCLTAPAASWTLTHCHLLPAHAPAPAEQHQELTPSRWSHFRGWEQMKGKTNPNAAPALLSLSLRPAPSQPQDCSSTICSLLLPKRPERQRGGESAALGAWFRMESSS